MDRNDPMIEVMKKIRRTPLFRELVPMEAGVGWPIPVRKQGQVYVTFPFFGYSAKGKGETELRPPFATITLDWNTKRPVEYVNLRFRNPWPEGKWNEPAGTFPHEAIAKKTGEEYLELRTELLGLYDELIAKLAAAEPVPESLDRRFGELLRLLIEPSLVPFYRALGPRFFDHFLTVRTQAD